MKRQPLTVLAALVLAVASGACTAASPPPASTEVAPVAPAADTAGAPTMPVTTTVSSFDSATAQQFQQVLDDTRATAGFPGVVAGIWSPAGSWVGASGTTGKDQTAAPTAADHTRIGSVTKTMTVSALLQLVEEGKVSLDDPIGKYFPGLPNGDVATLRQLANMTSGIPAYTADEAFQKAIFADPQRQWRPEELVDFVRGKESLFAPGKGWAYSNTNTVLLGMLIEQVTGKPIHEVFQERLFGPLGMSQTSYPPPGTTTLPDPHLLGLTEQGQPAGQAADATEWNPSYSFTAGEVISTLDDLHKWAVALGTGQGILKPETQALRLENIASTATGAPAGPTEDGYALGIGRRSGWWGHTGEIFGYNTVVNYNPETQTAVVVVVNSDIALPNTTPPQNPAPAVFAGLAKALAAGQ